MRRPRLPPRAVAATGHQGLFVIDVATKLIPGVNTASRPEWGKVRTINSKILKSNYSSNLKKSRWMVSTSKLYCIFHVSLGKGIIPNRVY